jgi:hypothetical protein
MLSHHQTADRPWRTPDTKSQIGRGGPPLIHPILLGIALVLVAVLATPASAILIDFNAPAYTDAPLPNQTDPVHGLWTTTSDVGFINVENTATNGRLVIQPNPSAPFHNASLLLAAPVAPDASGKIIASFDLIEGVGTDAGNIWKLLFKDIDGNDLARVQGFKDRASGRLPQAGPMITPPMIVGGANPTTRTMFIEIDTTGDGGTTSYYQDSISAANLLGSFPYITLNDEVAEIRVETFNRTDLEDNRARIDNISVVGAPDSRTWNVDANGNWTAAANWTMGVPNAAGIEAAFGSVITAPRTVTVDVPITVGSLNFDNANAYTIAGTNTLTLDATSGDAQINVVSGSHTISAPVTLTDNTTITVTPAASNLSITGALTATGRNLTKVGAGTVTLNNVRAAGLSVNGGTVAIAPAGTAAGTSALGALNIAGAANAWTAKFDVNNNDAVLQTTAGNKMTDFARLYNQVKQAFNNGNWQGLGVTSGTAAANANMDTGLAVVDNAVLGLTNFSGQPVTANSILLKYTYYGDIDQNGQVDADDLTVFANNFGRIFIEGATQVDGDIDFNGAINADDLTIFANNFLKGVGNPLAAASIQAVPEPATIVLTLAAAIAIAIATARRRRL